MDAEGPDLARRYARAAGATYPILVDAECVLATRYGFRAIPNGWIIDPAGVIRFRQIGKFDIRTPGTVDAIERTLKGISWSPGGVTASGPRDEADAAFREGVRLLHQGETKQALDAWFRAAEADPENLLVRKQIWHVLYPHRFEPAVDFAWQRAQLEREASFGVRDANPITDDPPNGASGSGA